MIGFGQLTYVPDDNFETFLESNGMGDGLINDSVLTTIISSVSTLDVSSFSIQDMTGIQDFINLQVLKCGDNQITVLDLDSNTALTELVCWDNQLTSLDVSNCVGLSKLKCQNNNLTTLDVTQNTNLWMLLFGGNDITTINLVNNTNLQFLYCEDNFISSLDLSNNTGLTYISAFNNIFLSSLDLRNINITNITGLNVSSTPLLNCIDVDFPSLASIMWPTKNFSINCGIALGCTDSLACNYDTLSTIDDGSCIYLNISVFISNVSCNGYSDGGIVATATGGATPNYQYSLGGGLSQNNGTFSNLTAGTYFIDVTDINGCSSNQTVIITEPNPLFVNAFSTDISCFGYCDGSAFCMPSGGTSPYSYLWSGGNTIVTDNISGLCAGAYVVNITDANNCINIETVLISEPLPLVSNNTINGCDSVLIGSNYYTISGAYTDTLTSVNGCDSVVNTNLTIEQNTSSYDTLSVGASIVWNGIPLNASGDYSVILINSVGCDSIVNLNLTVTTTGISDIVNNKSNLIKITDMLGQETPYRRNTPLFYIYDDGTVEKRIILE